MVNSQSQSADYDDKLPIEHSLREALNIYLKRLKVFFFVVIINILVFLFFISVQRLSVQFAYLLSVNIVTFVFFLIIIFLIPTLSFTYLRSNPVKGYLVFSERNVETSTINLYTGWRITKKKLYLNTRQFHVIFLVARNIRHHERMISDEPNRNHVYIQLQDKSRHILFHGEIVEGESIELNSDINVTYQSKKVL